LNRLENFDLILRKVAKESFLNYWNRIMNELDKSNIKNHRNSIVDNNNINNGSENKHYHNNNYNNENPVPTTVTESWQSFEYIWEQAFQDTLKHVQYMKECICNYNNN